MKMPKEAGVKTNFWCIHGIITWIVMLLFVSIWMFLTGYWNRLIILDDGSTCVWLVIAIIVSSIISWVVLFAIYIDLAVSIKKRLEAQGKIKADNTYMSKFHALIVILSAILFGISLAVFLEKKRDILQAPDYSSLRKTLLLIQKSSLDLRITFINLYMCIAMLCEKFYRDDFILSTAVLEGKERGRFGEQIILCIGATVIPVFGWTCLNIYSWL